MASSGIWDRSKNIYNLYISIDTLTGKGTRVRECDKAKEIYLNDAEL